MEMLLCQSYPSRCTASKHIREVLKMIQSQGDPCVFYKRSKEGKVVLIAVTHDVDDTLLGGKKTEIGWFRREIKKIFGYTDQGNVKKHLGIWYEEFKDESGEPFLVATCLKLIQGTINLCKNHSGGPAKE
jgi:hypothetical protein